MESRECPVSLIERNPEAERLVQISFDLSSAPEYAQSPFGPTHKWAGSFFDAVSLLATEDTRIEAAREEAIHKQ